MIIFSRSVNKIFQKKNTQLWKDTYQFDLVITDMISISPQTLSQVLYSFALSRYPFYYQITFPFVLLWLLFLYPIVCFIFAIIQSFFFLFYRNRCPFTFLSVFLQLLLPRLFFCFVYILSARPFVCFTLSILFSFFVAMLQISVQPTFT
jgi:hypothetical protein